MAIAGETAKSLSDPGGAPAGTQIQFMILEAIDERVQALPPADPLNPTWKESLFVRFGVVVERADGMRKETRWSQWKQASTTAYPMIPEGTADVLEIMHDAEKSDMGL